MENIELLVAVHLFKEISIRPFIVYVEFCLFHWRYLSSDGKP